MCVCVCVCVCVSVCLSVCLSSLVCMVGVIFVYVDTVHGFHGYSFFMLNWMFQHDYLECLICIRFVFCICTCSAQLSMFHMERRSRNTLVIIIIIINVKHWERGGVG